jgi:hypothetical protein
VTHIALAWRTADNSIPPVHTIADFYLKLKNNFLMGKASSPLQPQHNSKTKVDVA